MASPVDSTSTRAIVETTRSMAAATAKELRLGPYLPKGAGSKADLILEGTWTPQATPVSVPPPVKEAGTPAKRPHVEAGADLRRYGASCVKS